MGWYGFMTLDVTQQGFWQVVKREISQTSLSSKELTFNTHADGDLAYPNKSQAEKIGQVAAQYFQLPWIPDGQEYVIVGRIENPSSGKITYLARVLKQDGTVVKTFESVEEAKMVRVMQRYRKKHDLHVLHYTQKVK